MSSGKVRFQIKQEAWTWWIKTREATPEDIGPQGAGERDGSATKSTRHFLEDLGVFPSTHMVAYDNL